MNKPMSLREGRDIHREKGGSRLSGIDGRSPSGVVDETAQEIPTRIGREVIGPLCYGFVRWLTDRAHEAGIENLYFLARDGWLLKQAFDQLSPAIKGNIRSHYLYSSRRAVWFAALDEDTPEEEFNETLAGASPHVPVRDFLERIFLDPGKYKAQIVGAGFESANDIVRTDSDKEKLYRLLRNLKPEIMEQARHEREDYLAYLRDEGLFEHQSAGLVDVGWTGSIVKYTKKLARQAGSDIDLQAYFIGVGDNARTKYGFTEGESLHGYLFNFDNESHAEIRKAFFVIEKFLSPDEPSLIKMTRHNGGFKPVYKAGPKESSPMNGLVQKSALCFVQENRDATAPYSTRYFLPALKKMLTNPEPDVAQVLSRYSYSSDFGYGAEPSLIAHSQGTGSYLSRPLDLLRDYRRARWKAGFVAQQPFLARQLLRIVRSTGLDRGYDRLVAWRNRA